MQKKIYNLALIMVISLMMFSMVSAYKQNTEISLKIPTNETNCNITIVFPNSTNLIVEQTMTTGLGYNNYTISSTNTEETGTYTYFSECGSGTFEITRSGEESSNIWIQLVIIILLMGFVYLVVYRRNAFVGAIVFLVTGVVLMLIEPILPFAGLIILMTSLGLIVMELIPKRQNNTYLARMR